MAFEYAQAIVYKAVVSGNESFFGSIRLKWLPCTGLPILRVQYLNHLSNNARISEHEWLICLSISYRYL